MAYRGLDKTKTSLFSKLGGLFSRGLDDDFYDELEEALILADTGAATAEELCFTLQERVKKEKVKDEKTARKLMAEIAADMLKSDGPDYTYPLLLLVVGVNGAGKTTTIGKLSHIFQEQGKSVLLAAGDTFRAAAGEQLAIWAERTGAQIVRSGEGSDPASVVFDAIAAARARKTDVLICDTAGRLHNRKNLMDELSKIRRIVEREFTGCVRTLLVIDATTGLNGVEQSKVFREAA